MLMLVIKIHRKLLSMNTGSKGTIFCFIYVASEGKVKLMLYRRVIFLMFESNFIQIFRLWPFSSFLLFEYDRSKTTYLTVIKCNLIIVNSPK